MKLLKELKAYKDKRGNLLEISTQKLNKFKIKRLFYIWGNNKNFKRGSHAHLKTDQYLLCLSGKCKIYLFNGKKKKYFHLNNPKQILFIPKLMWHEVLFMSKDCLLLVLCNQFYNNRSDYIETIEEFKKKLKI